MAERHYSRVPCCTWLHAGQIGDGISSWWGSGIRAPLRALDDLAIQQRLAKKSAVHWIGATRPPAARPVPCPDLHQKRPPPVPLVGVSPTGGVPVRAAAALPCPLCPAPRLPDQTTSAPRAPQLEPALGPSSPASPSDQSRPNISVAADSTPLVVRNRLALGQSIADRFTAGGGALLAHPPLACGRLVTPSAAAGV